MAGVGQHPAAAAGASAVKHALHGAIAAALAAAAETDVDVTFGLQWPGKYNDAIGVTAVRTDPGEGTVSPQRRRHLTVSIDVSVVAWRSTDDEALASDRAYLLLGLVDEHIRTLDPTLAGTALWCLLGPTQSDGATTDDEAGEGRLTEIAATFESQIIVTS